MDFNACLSVCQGAQLNEACNLKIVIYLYMYKNIYEFIKQIKIDQFLKLLVK